MFNKFLKSAESRISSVCFCFAEEEYSDLQLSQLIHVL